MNTHPSDQYTIIRQLGEGGMGTVYLAEDKLLERRVAIKALNKPVTPAPESLESRFQQEALALARLNHPNITHLYSFIPRNDTYWMVMEFVEGHTLEEWVKLKGRLSPRLACSILAQLLDGLDHAHRKGIIHRDLKPANVMVSVDGEVKIMDFGIARIRNSQRLTQLGKSVGTLEYMAPEQVQGKEGDELTDIYAAGNILYELLTGHTPFSSDSDYQLMKIKLEERAPLAPLTAAYVPAALQKAVSTALERNPQKRFASARLLKEALLAAIGQPPVLEHQLVQALQTDTPGQEPEAQKTRSVKELIPASLPALQQALAKRIGRVKWPAIAAPRLFTARPWQWPGWLKDKSVRLLLGVTLFCLVLLTWNFLRKTDADQESPLTGNDNEEVIAGRPVHRVGEGEEGSPVSTDDATPIQKAPDQVVYQPAPKEKKTAPAEPVQRPPEKTKPQVPVTNQPKEEPTPVPVKPVTVNPEPRDPVKIPAGHMIKVVLNENLSSEQKERDGQPVRLSAAEDVKVDGRIIIRQGAPVVGKIVDVIPSGKRKKALIGFVVQKVQATDGSTIKLHSDRFRKQSLGVDDVAIYSAGTVFSVELGRGVVK